MTFAQIVRSSSDVRNAFAGHGTARIWWRCILRLHGKPVYVADPSMRRSILATGFQFYGRLYAFVALVFLIAAAVPIIAQIDHAASYAIPLTMTAAYLTFTSRVAIVAGGRYVDDVVGASSSLIAFFVAVMVFADSFIGSAATIALMTFPDQALLISFIVSGTLLLGVGSYLIEILFLFFDAVNRSLRSENHLSTGKVVLPGMNHEEAIQLIRQCGMTAQRWVQDIGM